MLFKQIINKQKNLNRFSFNTQNKLLIKNVYDCSTIYKLKQLKFVLKLIKNKNL